MIERVSYFFNVSRREVLEEWDLEELFRYSRKGLYFKLEEMGKAPKKPSTEQEKEYHRERKARLMKAYGYGEEKNGDSSGTSNKVHS